MQLCRCDPCAGLPNAESEPVQELAKKAIVEPGSLGNHLGDAIRFAWRDQARELSSEILPIQLDCVMVRTELRHRLKDCIESSRCSRS